MVESFRNAEGQPRQRVRLSLGDATIPEALWPEIANGVEDRLAGQASIFGASAEAIDWIDQIVRRIESDPQRRETALTAKPATLVEGETVDGVLLDQVTHGDTTPLGPALTALHAWNELGMPALLNDLSFNTLQQKALTINVINRLIDPVSENQLPVWQFDTSLPELLGRDSLPTTNDRFYRACDQILPHKERIEKHLREREGTCFSLDRTVVLYDLTNTYFEGVMRANGKARRGNSKEKRHDCPLVVVGMAFDQNGFELAHEVFEGNKNDGASMVEMVHRLQAVTEDDSEQRPLVIIDGGIANAENRKRLKDADLDFLANDSRPGRMKYAQWFAESEAFVPIEGRKPNETVLVRMLKDPLAGEGQEPDTLILCSSAGRGEKEKAMLSQAEERFLAAVDKLKSRITDGRLKLNDKIERAIGRLLAKHPRVSRYYDVTLSEGVLEVQRKEDPYAEAEQLHGCYVLRTSSDRLDTAEDWWKLYITLTRAEDGFRALKSDLGLRPIRHHREDRGDSHIFISVLAYHLLQFITYKLRQQGDHRSWGTIKRILATHCYTTLVLPTRDSGTHRLRKPGQPDARQQEIYEILGVNWRNLPSTHLIS